MITRDIFNRLLKGIGANLYSRAVVALIQLAGVPVLLHAWGTEVYGQWLILFAVPGYLSMTDLGFPIVAANDMTAQAAKGNRAEALSVFQSLIGLISVTTLAALGTVIALVFFLPVENWLHLGALPPLVTRWVLLLLCADVLVKLFDGVNHAGFRANGEFALHTALTTTIILVQNSLIWVAALSGFGPLGAAVVYFAVRAVSVPALLIFLVRRHAWLELGFRHARLSELKRLASPAFGMLLSFPLAQALNIQGMVLVVGAALGPIAVVTFSTLRTLTRLTLQLVASISHAAEAEFASMDLDEKKEQLSALYGQTMRLSVWVAASAMLAVAIFGPSFLAIWTRGQVSMDYPLFGWLLATVLSQTLWHGAMAMLVARNQHMRMARAQIVAAAGSVLFSYGLLRAFGDLALAGFVLFVFDVALMVAATYAVERSFGFSIAATLRSALDPRPLRALVRRADDS